MIKSIKRYSSLNQGLNFAEIQNQILLFSKSLQFSSLMKLYNNRSDYGHYAELAKALKVNGIELLDVDADFDEAAKLLIEKP